MAKFFKGNPNFVFCRRVEGVDNDNVIFAVLLVPQDGRFFMEVGSGSWSNRTSNNVFKFCYLIMYWSKAFKAQGVRDMVRSPDQTVLWYPGYLVGMERILYFSGCFGRIRVLFLK